ncbi:hypothetical protein BOX15_Mlig017494g3, partial [Macrostomum lignano]
ARAASAPTRSSVMAGAIMDSFYEVYKTAANEMGLRDRNWKQEKFFHPPGVADSQVDQAASQHGHSHGPDGACPSTAGNSHSQQPLLPLPPPPPPKTIFDAARNNDMQFLRSAAVDGIEGLAVRDSSGHTVAHWACLHGHLDVVAYLAEVSSNSKGVINLCHRASSHELAQYPIHWACVNGHVPVVEFLLDRCSVDIDVRDAKGATPLIIACQYGQTVTAGYLLSRGANRTSAGDNEGDTPLHWAAFKGQPDLMRLLVYSGFNPHQRDAFGQTPLHLASIAGNINAVRDLCRVDKVELNVADKNGKTPLMLAAGRRHDQVERFLKAEIRSRASMLGARFRWSHLIFGPPGNSKAPMLFLLFCILVWGYPTYVSKAVPLTFHLFPWLHWAFLLLNALMWFAFYHANTSDPGFLPRNVPEYDRAIQQAGVNSADIGLGRMGNPLERLCHTCRCVKPVRAKHCRVCDRCVLEMDHHCPYIYNCIGKNNRFAFAVLSVTLMTLGGMTMVLAAATLWLGGMDWIVLLGTVIATFGLTVGSVVSSCVWYHAAINMTTNESMNKKRYTYLKDSNGNFRNPFDRGIVNNLLEFCHMRSPRYTAHELSEIKCPSHMMV